MDQTDRITAFGRTQLNGAKSDGPLNVHKSAKKLIPFLIVRLMDYILFTGCKQMLQQVLNLILSRLTTTSVFVEVNLFQIMFEQFANFTPGF